MRLEDVGKRLHTQKFLHSAVFAHRFLLQEETFTQKSVFTDTLSCSTLISCERVAPGASKFQFYLSFKDPHFVRQFLTFNRHFARQPSGDRNFTSVFDVRSSFCATRLCCGQTNSHVAALLDVRCAEPPQRVAFGWASPRCYCHLKREI